MLNPARISQTVQRICRPIINRMRFSSMLDSVDSKDGLLIDQKLKQAPPIFVFQMGKVASTAIYQMLAGSGYPGLVAHAHSFTPYHSSGPIRSLFRHINSEKPKVKIITLVREPVSRNISAFFQNFKRDTGKDVLDANLSISQIRNVFLKNYPHEVPLVWFDNNIKKHFKIDVYQYPFPSCGFLQIHKGNTSLLILRHDLKNQQKEKLISEFTGISNLALSNDNVGSEKRYADLYSDFKESKLPLSHLYYLASSRYMKHFFRPEMRHILESWSDQPLP